MSNFPFEAHEDVSNNRSGIYAIVNLANNRIYIGSAVRLSKRKSTHLCQLNSGKHRNKHLQSSFNKYGKDFFVFKVVEYCGKEILITREQFWIDSFDFNNELYNLNPTAGSQLGRKCSEETRRKIGEISRNRSDETRKKISEASKRRRHSEATRKKLSESHKGHKALAVHQLDKNSGEILATFSSQTDAAKTLRGLKSNISEVCKGNRKTAYGYKWAYAE